MALKHSIVHKISRSSETAPIELSLREAETGSEDSIISLYEQLRTSFTRSTLKQVGQFDPERGDNPFVKLLRDFSEQSLSLMRLSQHLMRHLQQALDTFQQPFDAHILFALDHVVNYESLVIFWIEHQEFLHISQTLDVELVQGIDTKHLIAGMSINLSDYQEAPGEKYLSIYTARGQKEVGACFEYFSCFTSEVNTVAETEAFLEIVEQYTEQLPEEQAEIKRSDIIDYCIEQNMAGEPVHVEVLSTVVNEREPEDFANFVSQHQEVPKASIHTHRPSLKRYGRISGRNKDISLSFSASLVGEGIEFDADQDALIIRQLPKGLKEQLVKAARKKEVSTSE